MKREEILQSAIDTYGEKMQEDICIEEMSELTKAIIKNRRKEYMETANILEEIADVQIMLDQMRLIFGDTAEQEDYKLKRLEKRIAKEKRNL